MPRMLAPGELYKGRRASSEVMYITVDREAAHLAREYAGGKKALGAFMNRLIYEHRARTEEREKYQRKNGSTAKEA